MKIIPGPEWQDLLGVIMKLEGAVMIIGATDSGKSTLVRYLISKLLSGGTSVSLVDTDVGQASLGPPGTISFRTFSPEEDMEKVTPDRMFFVGAVNPATRIPVIIRITRTAAGECRKKSDTVIMDTSGLVSGRIGETLKIGKIRAVRPEHIVAVQKSDEIEHILKLVTNTDIFRVAASDAVNARDSVKRVRYREKKYEDYFGDVRQPENLLHFREAELFYNGKTLSPRSGSFPKGNIIGLNHGEETIALGLLTEIADDWITFTSPLVSLSGINRIVFGDITFRE